MKETYTYKNGQFLPAVTSGTLPGGIKVSTALKVGALAIGIIILYKVLK